MDALAEAAELRHGQVVQIWRRVAHPPHRARELVRRDREVVEFGARGEPRPAIKLEPRLPATALQAEERAEELVDERKLRLELARARKLRLGARARRRGQQVCSAQIARQRRACLLYTSPSPRD